MWGQANGGQSQLVAIQNTNVGGKETKPSVQSLNTAIWCLLQAVNKESIVCDVYSQETQGQDGQSSERFSVSLPD